MAPLVEPNRGLIELYHRAEVMNDAIARLEDRGAATVRIDAGSWDRTGALEDLAASLDFPDYFGGNLDALADCLFDVVSGEYGFASDARIRLLALYQFEAFQRAEPDLAVALLEVLFETALMALKLGSPFLVLLQSDDPDLRLPPVGAQTVGWNQAEFQRTRRSQA